MKAAVIIASLGRPCVLTDTLARLQRQTLVPTEIIVAVPDAKSEPAKPHGARVITSRVGASAQRNDALNALSSDPDLVVFLDDDMELERGYIAKMSRMFADNPHIVIATGTLIADGRSSEREVSRSEAIHLLASCRPDESVRFVTYGGAGRGNNMVVRGSLAQHLRFDERLPLYSYLEDGDYAFQCLEHGSQAVVQNAYAVHLRVGRAGGNARRFSYSQIVNPLYLARKWHWRGYSRVDVFYRFWFRAIAGNIRRRSLTRLYGNLLALFHIMSGRIEPERIWRMH